MAKDRCCNTTLTECFRFTDWYNDSNDKYGTFEECKKLFDQAVKADPEGRYSIYDVSFCAECDYALDEGVLFNKKCPDYI